MKTILLFLFQLIIFSSFGFNRVEIERWKNRAKQVTIVRDKWGIPHIYGKTDADCVFGLMYAQCEDDFQRVEMNYITMLGRTAEIKGESAIYDDLLVKMVIDSAASVKDYQRSPTWMKKLLNAFADGVNYYLYTHPEKKPALLKTFKPWYPLTYTDGSISAIQTSDLTARDIKAFYEGMSINLAQIKSEKEEKLAGSNGFAIAPHKTKSGNAMLYINPHVTFYFRPEVHMVSQEGLNVYGAVTWGQFFVYQGFNESCGWMHTSSNADVADLYEEKVSRVDPIGKVNFKYEYDKKMLPINEKVTSIFYKSNEDVVKKDFTIYSTHHGPIMARSGEKWIAMKSNNRSLNGLIQSWSRTKAKSFKEFKQILNLRENVSNNTVYADKEGNIAYWHGNFMPKRDNQFDWNQPQDGSSPNTEWQGLHQVDETVHLINPKTGWLQNCNSTPFTAAGPGVINKSDFPIYMAPDAENFRGINAVRLLKNIEKIDMNELISIGYNRYLSAFDILLPSLFSAEPQAGSNVKEAIQQLKNWDRYSSNESVATTLAILWAEKILPIAIKGNKDLDLTNDLADLMNQVPNAVKISVMENVIQKLINDFGTWKIGWGEINRFQRIENSLDLKFDDNQPSIPSPFASSQWGSLPSYNSKSFNNSKKRYGYGGNSFICAVEFGKKVKAKSLLAGGESGDVNSAYFKNQAEMYTQGKFKDVLFYKEDVLKHKKDIYHPGFK
ncbi:MAG: hypothetical protein RJA76_247 [Bacteroidota bacterium]|jgi:acyl-homoserine lactone acylase PvdQ